MWNVDQKLNYENLGLCLNIDSNHYMYIQYVDIMLYIYWAWFDLSLSYKIECHKIKWNVKHYLLNMFHINFHHRMHHWWAPCGLCKPTSGFGYFIPHSLVSYILHPNYISQIFYPNLPPPTLFSHLPPPTFVYPQSPSSHFLCYHPHVM